MFTQDPAPTQHPSPSKSSAHTRRAPSTGINVSSSHYRQNHHFQVISTSVTCSEPSDGCRSLSERNPEPPTVALRSYMVSLASAWKTSFPLLFLWFFPTQCNSHAIECTDLKHKLNWDSLVYTPRWPPPRSRHRIIPSYFPPVNTRFHPQ